MSKDIEDIRIEVAISCIQGVLEAKGGIIGEIDPGLAVKEAFRIADAFVKHYKENYESKPIGLEHTYIFDLNKDGKKEDE